MAEFCKDCFVAVLGGNPKDRLVLSGKDDLDICEGCGKYTQVVVRVKRAPFSRIRDIVEAIKERKEMSCGEQ